MFWGEVLVIMIEGCMEFLISGFLNIKYPSPSNKSGETIALLYGYFSLIKVIIIMPKMYIWLLNKPLKYI